MGVLCRVSDRTVWGWQGAEALARGLARRAGVAPVLTGEPGPAREAPWQEDLEQARDCLRDTGERVRQSLAAGQYPITCAPDCSIALATLPALALERPQAWVLWIDAHADFNSPDTTRSGFLGGMALAGACGVWDSGLGSGPDPSRVILCAARDLDPDESHLLAASEVCQAGSGDLASLVAGRQIYVHLDLDVLDSGVLPGQAFPAERGLDEEHLRELLADVALGADLVGCEITDMTAPELTAGIVETIAPLVPQQL
jgi:arginase